MSKVESVIERVDPISGFSLTRDTISGLFVATKLEKDGLILPDKLIVPDQTLYLSPQPLAIKQELVLPKRKQPSSEIMNKIVAEIMQGKSATEPHSETWRSSELALAICNPNLFLAKELEQKLPVGDKAAEVLSYFRNGYSDVTGLTTEALERKRKTVKAYDIHNGQTSELTISTPGAIEQAGIVILDLLKEPYFRGDEGTIIIQPLSSMIQNYRLQTVGMRETPEMPDLTMKAIEILDFFAVRPGMRYQLYKLLEQISIPPTLRLDILQKMDKYQDLDHPLAFQLTLAEAERADSPWIAIQQERREQLLDQLSLPNQELFEKFDELFSLSRDLVYHGDPRNPEPGKVGMEIEFVPGRKDAIYKVRHNQQNKLVSPAYFRRGRGLGDAWPIHFQHIDPQVPHFRGTIPPEVTRADNQLEHNTQYSSSLVTLYKWFGDNAQKLVSLHIHLDKDKHPFIPIMGGLFEGEDSTAGRRHSTGDDSTAKLIRTVDASKRDLNTWEVRPVILPRGISNFHPGRVEDLIGLYIGASSFDNSLDNLEKISIKTDTVALQQLLWGHIVTFVKDPNARLAALMSLHDGKALKYCNPLAFVHTYSSESLTIIASSLRPDITDISDYAMINILEYIGNGNTKELFSDLSSRLITIAANVLGRELLIEYDQLDTAILAEAGFLLSNYKYNYKLFPSFHHWIHRHKEILLAQYGVESKKRWTKEEETVSLGGLFEKDRIIELIKNNAQSRVSRVQDLFCEDDWQIANLSADKRRRLQEKVFQKALEFDTVFLSFLDSYLFNMSDSLYTGSEALFMVDNRGKAWNEYKTEKKRQVYSKLHLFFALERASDEICRNLMNEQTVDYDKALSFDEDALFEERNQQLFADMAFFDQSPENSYVQMMKRVHDRIKEGLLIMRITDPKKARAILSPAIALLVWANEHGVTDARLEPLKDIIKFMYHYDNLPHTYDRLLEDGFLGIDSEGLTKFPGKLR